MASATFPLIQSGSFTAPSGVANIHFDRVELERKEKVDNVTGSSGGAADASLVFIHGVPTVGATGYGHLQLDSDSSQALAQSSTLTPGLTIRPGNWLFRRVWPLQDVTGSGDGEKNWTWGLPMDQVQVAGWALASGPGFTSNSITVATVIDDFGTVTGTLKLDAKKMNAMFGTGGNVPVSYSGRYSDTVAYTGTNFSWLFPTAPADPVKSTLTVNHSTADTVSNSAIMYDFTLQVGRTEGGKVPVVCKFRFDEA